MNISTLDLVIIVAYLIGITYIGISLYAGAILFESFLGINLLVPTGLKGLLAAGLLAALMSTIAAALNSCATLISVDIVKRLKPEVTDSQQVKIGRISGILDPRVLSIALFALLAVLYIFLR